LKKHFGVGEARVAEIVGEMIGKSDRTAREWKANFISNEGTINESKQGKYKRTGLVWENEELNTKAKKHKRLNNSVKGYPNLTVSSFCQ
jgi:hypothetical protein